jgi:Tfp pilus assembly protein PilZ
MTMIRNTNMLVSDIDPQESCPLNAKQRRATRYSLGAAVELTDLESGRMKVGLVRALSLHGCFVKTEMPLTVGARVLLKIAHSGSEFSAIARVAVRLADRTNKGIGVAFTELASIDRARLEACLADLVREKKLAGFAALRKKS